MLGRYLSKMQTSGNDFKRPVSYASFMKIITENKKGLHNYKVVEKFNAGVKLSGSEVKSVKNGKIDLNGSYVTGIINSKTKHLEMWLMGAKIAKYQKSGYSQNNYQPDSKRKILLKKKEINYLAGKIRQKGLTIIPVLVYTSQRLIKLEIAVVTGKKQIDKRELLKRKDIDRQIRQKMKFK